ncbi:hypothetical protein S7711_09823 [Stachybotrys chartarum IBT 7711]|uniref:Transcription factor domain-containing protein n=1 Tax=Stachybotrys chartarum (strain CBS 109288 / IBT 7711) TaxID=1280523 RepID=A0A084B7N4_STACB|nr:hypothetical protein S7711_09823 [Stachybotrys chartarum IBT 7711]
MQGFRILRPLIFDIDGTETERSLFHKFKVAADIGLSLHVCDCTSFWNRLALRLAHQEDAVKHALVALGAAYQRYRVVERATDDNGGAQISELETLTIIQYNKALFNLRQQVAKQLPQSVELTLICCLLFLCLENLRSSYVGALDHLKYGLRVIVSLVDLQDCYGLVTRRIAPQRDDNQTTSGSYFTRRDWRDLILQFRRSEVCASAFSNSLEPLIALKLYNISRFDDGRITYASEFSSLAAAHDAAFSYTSDVYARAWEVRNHKGDIEFWRNPRVQHEQQCLRGRGRRLVTKYARFMSSRIAPGPGTAEHFSGYVDLILLKCAQIILEKIPYPGSETANTEGQGISHESTFKAIIYLASLLQKGSIQAPRKTCPLPDLGIIAPVYVVYTTSNDTELKSRAAELLKQMCRRDELWDAKFLVRLLRRIEQISQGNDAWIEEDHDSCPRNARQLDLMLSREETDSTMASFPSGFVLCIPN